MNRPPLPEQLHLGCGRFAPDGWLNTDGSWHVWLARWPLMRRVATWTRMLPQEHSAQPWPDSIMHLDLRRPLPFPDDSFTAVYASHLLEHLYRSEALALLQELWRCCRPGGIVRMAVPDLAYYVACYQRGVVSPRAAGHSPADTLMHRLLLQPATPLTSRFWPRKLYHLLLDYNSHKWCYDRDSLLALFREAGFAQPEERAVLDSRIPAIDRIEMAKQIGGGGTVIVEAEKRP
ncbi:MAG: methyltransferase domain-containing protein [Magnetococcales bacterium]|nr:methyltransferase domain-containing protein [Magnetococcales bacterium]